jgi:L-arabinokinase
MEAARRPCSVRVPLGELRDGDGAFLPLERARARLTARPDEAWGAYVLGAVPVLAREGIWSLPAGGTFFVWSDVPIGVGVASSAALEVATLAALSAHAGLEVAPTRLGVLGQVVENRIVGAPCGIMDQVTAALGRPGKLLGLRCRPCEVLGQFELPEGVRVFGLSSRVEHSVGGSPYTTARVAAFMGLKVILTEKQKRCEALTEQDRYLCNVPLEDYVERWRSLLPEHTTGRAFLQTYGPTTDVVTQVDPAATYRVRNGADHPLFENRRVMAFMQCLHRAHAGDRTALVEAGGLMAGSHWSYSWNCALGSEGTDLLVKLARHYGPERGIYGAKITGGGSGGTVALLAEQSAEPAVREIAARYHELTDLDPDVFDGTSPGACAFGARHYTVET